MATRIKKRRSISDFRHVYRRSAICTHDDLLSNGGAEQPLRNHGGMRAVLIAGVTCGVLDGISATVVSALFGGTPLRLFQGIAIGLLGRSALQGGLSTALLGLALHFVVATGAAATYYLASRRISLMMERPLLCGVIYGALVHLFMTFVVIPLSAIGVRPFVWQTFSAFLLVSMVVVGPSIALTLRRMTQPASTAGY